MVRRGTEQRIGAKDSYRGTGTGTGTGTGSGTGTGTGMGMGMGTEYWVRTPKVGVRGKGRAAQACNMVSGQSTGQDNTDYWTAL